MFLNRLLNFSGIDSQNVSGLSSAPMGHCIKTNGTALYPSLYATSPLRYGWLGNLQVSNGCLGDRTNICSNNALLERHKNEKENCSGASEPGCLFDLVVESAHGQGLGSIAGTITDPTGAAIVSAQITVTQIGTGFAREAATTPGDIISCLLFVPPTTP